MIRQRTKAIDVAQRISGGSVTFVEELMTVVLEWRPRSGKRCVWRHPARWIDDIRKVAGSDGEMKIEHNSVPLFNTVLT